MTKPNYNFPSQRNDVPFDLSEIKGFKPRKKKWQLAYSWPPQKAVVDVSATKTQDMTIDLRGIYGPMPRRKKEEEEDRPLLTFACFLVACLSITAFVIALGV